jgi:hypothetical protein
MQWVVRITPRPRFSSAERTPGTHCTGGWVSPRACLDTENSIKILSLLPGIEPRSPGRPAHSQTLYWLSYPARILYSTFKDWASLTAPRQFLFRIRCKILQQGEHAIARSPTIEAQDGTTNPNIHFLNAIASVFLHKEKRKGRKRSSRFQCLHQVYIACHFLHFLFLFHGLKVFKKLVLRLRFAQQTQ